MTSCSLLASSSNLHSLQTGYWFPGYYYSIGNLLSYFSAFAEDYLGLRLFLKTDVEAAQIIFCKSIANDRRFLICNSRALSDTNLTLK